MFLYQTAVKMENLLVQCHILKINGFQFIVFLISQAAFLQNPNMV